MCSADDDDDGAAGDTREKNEGPRGPMTRRGRYSRILRSVADLSARNDGQ